MKDILNPIITEIRKELKPPQNIVIITHVNPDGDGIGSSIGLYHFLETEGHSVEVVTPNDFPDFLKWLPSSNKIIRYDGNPNKAIKVVSNADIIFCLDFNDTKRLNGLGEHLDKATAVKIMIDHHPYPTDFAAYQISETSVSSTAELIFEFINAWNKKIIKPVAESLFTGILTDTGCFNFNSSRPRTYEIVSHLLECGINKDEIFSNIFDNYSADRMRLMGYCLAEKMVLLPEFNTAYISLSQEELKSHNYRFGDLEGIVNLPMSIKGIIFVAMIIEKVDHVRISFRSKGDFPTNEIANKYFEGGGHKNASGGQSNISLEETIKKFTSILPSVKDLLVETKN